MCVCVCVIYICTPGGKTAPIGAKDLVESFHPQVNEISSNIQRYGLFLAFSPIFCFLYISFCYYNILSSVVMYISNLSAIYRHWGHGREREPLGANGFDLFFNPIIYRMAIKRKQQHRPNPPEKKGIKMDDDFILYKKEKKNFDLMLGIVFRRRWLWLVLVKCDGQSDHHQSTTRVKVRSTHSRTYHISLYGGAL